MTIPSTHHPSRRRRLLAGVAAAGAGAILAIGAPLAASAHVIVSPDSAPSGDTTPLTFSFQHGCDDSPTTALKISIPEGVGNVTPVVEGGWSIDRTLGKDDIPTEVTFTADHPIEKGLSASVSMKVLLDSSLKGKTVTFPVVQECVSGQTEWNEVASDSQDPHDLDHPAPAVTVGAAAPVAEGDADASADTAGTSSSDPTARWLAGGGLVLGAAAVVISLIRRNRVRS